MARFDNYLRCCRSSTRGIADLPAVEKELVEVNLFSLMVLH